MVIASSTPRAFCAGGDIRFAREVILAGQHTTADQFFRDEYLGDLAVAEFDEPIIALADGLVMGGGARQPVMPPFVVTETTRCDAGKRYWTFRRRGKPVLWPLFRPGASFRDGGHIINGADCLLWGYTDMVQNYRYCILEKAILKVMR